jgi:ABC-type uncharacterized transport system substrate-binding protein
VFIIGDDPVQAGLVASLNRPGGNVTGVSLIIGELVAKRFELLTELVSNAAMIAVLVNPSNRIAETDAREAQLAARAHGRQIVLLNASNAAEIDAAFATVAQQGAGAILFGSDILFTSQLNRYSPDESRVGVNIGGFPALLQDRRAVPTATTIAGARRSVGQPGLAIFLGIRAHSSPWLLLNA